jgi:hypothetical protein
MRNGKKLEGRDQGTHREPIILLSKRLGEEERRPLVAPEDAVLDGRQRV